MLHLATPLSVVNGAVSREVTDNTGLSHRPRENHILDLHRYVCRGDGVCGGHGDGARL